MAVSRYEMNKRKARLAAAMTDLRQKRPTLLAAINSGDLGREAYIWSYLLLRRDVERARGAAAEAVEKAPNWSPAVRAARGWN